MLVYLNWLPGFMQISRIRGSPSSRAKERGRIIRVVVRPAGSNIIALSVFSALRVSQLKKSQTVDDRKNNLPCFEFKAVFCLVLAYSAPSKQIKWSSVPSLR